MNNINMFTFCFSVLFRIWMAEPSNARCPEHHRPFLSVSDFKGRVVAGAGGGKNRLLSSHAPSGGNQGKPTEPSVPCLISIPKVCMMYRIPNHFLRLAYARRAFRKETSPTTDDHLDQTHTSEPTLD